jgi:hypothetical protein
VNNARSKEAVIQTHEVFYRQAYERIEIAYLKAQQHGILDVVLTLMDFSDPLAEQIGKAIGVLDTAKGQIALATHRGGISLATSWGTRASIRSIFEDYPVVAEMLTRRPSPGTFHTLIVADGGVSLRETKIPE